MGSARAKGRKPARKAFCVKKNKEILYEPKMSKKYTDFCGLTVKVDRVRLTVSEI
jgi:hypothetical protein